MKLGAITTVGRRLPDAVMRAFERRDGRLQGDAGRAAGAMRVFLAIALASTVGYLVMLVATGIPGGPIPILNVVVTVLFVAMWVALSRGHQLGVAIVFLSLSIGAVVYMTALTGWRAGHQLYLITAAQIVFIVFTDRQRAWRWTFVVIGAVTFLACQLLAPPLGPFAPPTDGDLGTIFTVNAVITATLMFVLSGVAHHRAILAQDQAGQHAARAEYLANTDPLTGLANRRPIAARLDELAGGDATYAVAVADLDRFKQLNDQHGHICGDRVLSTIGERLRDQLRVTDALGRWGGEEFIFVLADTGLDDARTMMERMRHLVGDEPIPCGDHVHPVTMSIGVSDSAGDDVAHRVVKRADDALYDAKQAGRDRVMTRTARATDQDVALDEPRSRRGGE
ncbi:GGDEF domain-containing protein [Demequina lignilytica]|uniref:Diguanylate cyclase n=1 Tax=Demequina lignilytica TaxID=3051663 RepID=A0AAW7M1L8_9MICO|nr:MULTISPECIES: diguanylate cyclase [unclassified Demequina]MDN4478176.1 diguanylate cyclase [Demequina sp. SYSU T00039-1]MDN4482745.1 diguanylate cyclase [Demequina sp. SYSU T0a273]MDN4488374.1 diguanylate cyclase [Demequina sp. SYSU T00039]MDN4490079.1 diguanylate cyclase [Demequina sp. SYSU T00068]